MNEGTCSSSTELSDPPPQSIPFTVGDEDDGNPASDRGDYTPRQLDDFNVYNEFVE